MKAVAETDRSGGVEVSRVTVGTLDTSCVSQPRFCELPDGELICLDEDFEEPRVLFSTHYLGVYDHAGRAEVPAAPLLPLLRPKR